MTKQESFKDRIRARMEKTGERFTAARRVLIEQASKVSNQRGWVTEPELTDEVILANTGKNWDGWTALLDSWGASAKGHTAIAAHLTDELGVDGWWAQSVTHGYERIKGLRLRYQQHDGTFTANKSKTIRMKQTTLRRMLVTEEGRGDLFPDFQTDLRSGPTAKAIRIAIGPGVAQFYLEPASEGRVKVTVAHERLGSTEDAELWKKYWSEWLDELDQS
ncbi:MAG TPA: hypothetical protein VIA81_03800 [Acidimicrobiia bacterium]|jgi:hypothetical protein